MERKLQILVVEDEYYTRKSLRRIVESVFESFDVLEADNGMDALDIIEQNNIEIVLTDIRMPKMNGLELASKLRETNPDIMVVIITGHAEFEYARQAINLKVNEYILKPIQTEEVLAVIKRLLTVIDQKKQEVTKMQSLEIQAKDSMNLQYLGNVFMKREKLEVNGVIKALEVDEAIASYKLAIIRAREVINDSWRLKITEKLNQNSGFSCYFGILSRNEVLVLMYGTSDIKDLTLSEKHLRQMLYASNGHLVGGISPQHDNLDELLQAYDEAHLALINYLKDEWGRLHVFSRGAEDESELESEIRNEIRILAHTMQIGDMETCEKSYVQIKKIILDEKLSSIFLYNVLTELIGLIENKCKSIDLDYNKVVIEQYDTLEKLLEHVWEMISCICLHHQDKGEDIVTDLIEYMNLHYFEDVSLKELAECRYFVSSAYLSRIFRERTGETFSALLMETRLDKAGELLRDSSISVTEIATLVGYNNVAYFNKVFKRQYGMTPMQHRNRDISNE